MHQGWRWFRAVVAATALGGVGFVGMGCSNTGDAQEPPGSIGCDDGADCAPPEAPETPGNPDGPAPGEPPVEEPPDTGPRPHEDIPTPPPPPPPPGPGSTLWLEREGTAQDDLALDAAVDSSGDIFTVAVHGLDDLHTRQPTDDKVQLVVTRRAGTGEKRWTRTFDVRAPETPAERRAFVQARVAAHPAGGLLLAGSAEGVVDFQTRELGDGAFVARLDADGNLVWASMPSGRGLTVADVAVDSQGRALVAFNLSEPADFGGVRGSSASVVTYTPDGRAERALRIGRPEGDADRVELTTVAVDGRGRLAVGGRYTGAVRFGSQTSSSARDGSPFLAVYEDTGSLAWARPLHTASGSVTEVGLDGLGTLVATGPFHGSLTWAGKKLEGHAYRDTPFLLSADASGRERWSRNLGDGIQAGSLAVEPSGEVVVAAFTYNRIEDGGAGPDGMGSPQPVALRYGVDGASVATRMFLSDPPETRGELFGLDALPSTLILPGGDAVLFGHTDRDTDFGFGRRSAARGDVFLLRLMR